jgi:iron complex transport system substrate-binding protein
MVKWMTLGALLAGWIALGTLRFGSRAVLAHAEGTQPPARIVALAPNVTEILFALGLADCIVGVTQYSDYPPAAKDKPKVGTFWQPNVEAIIALKPNLVVMALTTQQQNSLMGRLERMGYPCLGFNLWYVRDLFEAIDAIGRATGTSARARQLRREITGNIEQLRDACAGKPRRKVLWVVQRDPLRVAGRNTFANELIELAGGENAIGATVHKYPPIGAEQVIASGVEIILEPTMFDGVQTQQQAQAVAAWSRYPQVPAVAEGRIYVIDGDLVSRLGPRLYEGVESIARCLHPELFTE